MTGAPGPAAGQQYADVASYRLARGDPAGGREPAPVLMLHGLGGDSGQLWPEAGGDPTRSRLAPDLRAHGATMLVGDRASFTFAGLTEDLTALLDRLRFPPAVVVGLSMGAGVAAALALREPARVRGLVLIRPAWLDAPRPPNLLPLVQAGHFLRRYGTKRGLARFLESRHYARVLEQSPAAAASLAGQFSAPHAAARSVRLTDLPRSVPFGQIADLGRVGVPAVVIGARADPQHPIEIAEIWAAALPSGRLVKAPPRDTDLAGYHACLAQVTGEFVAAIDAERQSRHGS